MALKVKKNYKVVANIMVADKKVLEPGTFLSDSEIKDLGNDLGWLVKENFLEIHESPIVEEKPKK